MAKRILVPLDQTVDSESVLPMIAEAVRGGGASVRLIHVFPVPDNVMGRDGHLVAYADQEMARLEAEGLDYLRAMETKLGGAAVECVVRFGEPVKEILREAEAFGADLIAMTTRRRHQLSRLVLGSTAEQICRRTDLPVLVFRPGAGEQG